MRIAIPAIVVPVVVVLLYIFLPGVKELPWDTLRITGAILAVIAYVMVCVARLQLGKSFSVQPKAKALVTHGLYSRLRNPLYVFVDIMTFGIILVLRVYWLFLILPIGITMQTLQARREARVLEQAFGRAYIDYRSRTWF